ncbi:AAA family ATPase [Sulfurimonas hydrogeniphila]|uniref:AAA family ATPase n=1 Tax=Sulfurimonas hydrogeniphila TaxID=2509341 RepID=UPI00125F02E8|nr:AAA family ATPase [Sulfurimonas hydrogeniphila]
MRKSISEIEKEVKKTEAKVARLMYLEELKLSDYIKDHDIMVIEKEMISIQNELKLKTEKNLSDLDNFLDGFDLEYEKIENAKFEYLYQNFIVKNEITMFAAPPSSGKSLISVALCNIFLLEKRINQIIYFDADNGTATLKERNIHKLKKKWIKKFRYFHESQITKAQMLQIINQLKKTNLKNVLVVFDSIKNFMIGGDRDKNRDVSKVMEVLKSLRARGATVLFLHHTNKPNKDLQELVYAGSSAFQEDTGNAYIMQKNEYKQSFIFKNFKARTGDLTDIAFQYGDNHTLTEVDFIEASETQEIVEINEVVIEFLEKQSQKPSYSQIMQHLQKAGYSRNKSNQALQNSKGRYWQEEKLTQNNKSVYFLIPQKPNIVEIEYLDADNNLQRNEQIIKTPRTSDISRTSPILGRYDNSNTTVQVHTGENMNIDIPVLQEKRL